MIHERIEHFEFCQPVVFTLDDNPGTTQYAKWGWVIGSLADQYASLSQKTLHVNAERINARKLYFESENIKNVSLWLTALKVGSYILSLGSLPLMALVIKVIFKHHLNTCKVLTKKSPNEVIVETQIGKTRMALLYGSLMDETTDAIVNAANAALGTGGGLCFVVQQNAGDKPFDECKEILKEQKRNQLDIGEAVLTSAGDLAPRIKAIVHAVGPNYHVKEEAANGEELLIAAHRNSLELVSDLKGHAKFVHANAQGHTYHSIAFPAISVGIFNAPLAKAAPIALATTKKFVEENPDAFEEIRFVFLPPNHPQCNPKIVPAYQKAFDELFKKKNSSKQDPEEPHLDAELDEQESI